MNESKNQPGYVVKIPAIDTDITSNIHNSLISSHKDLAEVARLIEKYIGKEVVYKGKKWKIDSVDSNTRLGVQVVLRLGDRTESVSVYASCFEKLTKTK